MYYQTEQKKRLLFLRLLAHLIQDAKGWLKKKKIKYAIFCFLFLPISIPVIIANKKLNKIEWLIP
ncbi:MAG: hypothetical protein LRY27_04785, partial [Chitinophagales bacterium]|nr:hypothetical protein [Chitinophagales bacterium]